MTDSRHILLVEDEPTLQRILGSVLTDAGHVVESVGTAEAALTRLEDDGAESVDLVLSDKNLPSMTGLELLQKIRTRDRASSTTRAFVLVTGYPSRDSALELLEVGGDGYLVKPFRSLLHAVEHIQAVFKIDLAGRRRAAHVARRVAEVLRGETDSTEAGLRAAVLLDDEGDAERVKNRLERSGATVCALDDLGDTNPRALVAGRVEDLAAFRENEADVGLVLADAGVSFNDVVRLIDAGGGAVIDPALVPA